jgi:hypothetical protein
MESSKSSNRAAFVAVRGTYPVDPRVVFQEKEIEELEQGITNLQRQQDLQYQQGHVYRPPLEPLSAHFSASTAEIFSASRFCFANLSCCPPRDI